MTPFININPCYILMIFGDRPFDNDENFLQVQFWCKTDEFCHPERWLAVPKHRASRFTKEAVTERLSKSPDSTTVLAGIAPNQIDACFELSADDFEELNLELIPIYVPNWDSNQLRLPI